MTAALASGSVHRHLVALTVPMVWGVLAMMAFNVVDTWFVAQLGDRELAAMSFTFPVVMVLISLGIGLMAGTSSVLALAIGAGHTERVKRLSTDALLGATALAIVLTAAGLATMEPLFTLLGADDAVRPLVLEYMTVWYAGFVFVLVPMVGFGALRAVGDSKVQGTIFLVASIANAALDPLLIFGLGAWGGLGLRGAAIATVCSRALTMAAAYWAMNHKHDLLARSLPTARQFWRSTVSVFHVGLPAAGTNMIIPAATAAIVALMAEYGSHAVAAFGAATRIEQLTLVPFYALSAVIGPFVGQNLGAGEHGRVREAMRACGLFCMGLGLLTALLLAVGAEPVMGLFTEDPRVLDIGRTYLWIVPLSNGAYGVVMVVNASFNGLGKPGPGVAISVIRMMVLYLPLAWVGARLVDVPGIFVGACIANLIAGAVAYGWIARATRLESSDA